MIDILSSIKQHEFRSLLIGFDIGWSILILVILLGVSSGTEKVMLETIKDFAQNRLCFYGGSVSTESWKLTIVINHNTHSPIGILLYCILLIHN